MTNSIKIDNIDLNYYDLLKFISEVEDLINYGEKVINNNIENPNFRRTLEQDLNIMLEELKNTAKFLDDNQDFEDIDISSDNLLQMKKELGLIV